jgi:hypothetical protein
LLGIERDTFLLLSRHVNLENTDDKIRNVWTRYFLNILNFFFLNLDDRDMLGEFCLD